MKRATSDTEIRAGLRAVLARHRMDLTKTSFVCVRGVVRLHGEIEHQGAFAATPVRRAEMEAIETEVQRLNGIVRVHYELRNWRRGEAGNWAHVEPRPRARMAA